MLQPKSGISRRELLKIAAMASGTVLTACVPITQAPSLDSKEITMSNDILSTATDTITQVAVYHGATSQELFEIYTNAEKHTAATHPGSGQVRFFDSETETDYDNAEPGLEMNAFYLPDGTPGLVGKVLDIIENRRVVVEWINFAWNAALDPAEISDVPSILALEFRDNTVGAEIIMTHIGVPSYEVSVTPSPFNPEGEVGPLSEIVRVHWELLYWQPIREYLKS
ncbi:hypothetical protein KFU94_07695 [Chloroflexi bacterium TSY]|nr:hypothetical protein [Chloroflexi bacterium TSY]